MHRARANIQAGMESLTPAKTSQSVEMRPFSATRGGKRPEIAMKMFDQTLAIFKTPE